jgi:methyl coenzyme M reductase alpha subunit
MAAVPLNRFKTIRKKLTPTLSGVYTCPIGVSAIITLCNATNVSSGIALSTYTITGIHSRTDGTGGYTFSNQDQIPAKDSLNLFPDGRLAMETNDVLYFSSNGNNQIDLIISVLETAKQ